MKIEFLRDYQHYKKGQVVDGAGGWCDVLVNRRSPPIARYVDPQTLVPVIPGLSQLVQAVTGKRKRA